MRLLQNIAKAARALSGEELYGFEEFMDKFFVNSSHWDRWRIYDVFFARKPGALLHATQSTETFLVDTADNVMSREIFVSGSSQLDTVQRALAIIEKERGLDLASKTFIDIGANIGVLCIPVVARGLCKAAAAIEPTPSTCRVLRANIALNGLQDKISVVEAALSDRKGVAEFELSRENSGDNRLSVVAETNIFNEDQRPKISVPMERFDDLFANLDMNDVVVWMDVQGFEGFVLAGASRILENRTPLVVEFWPYGMKRANSYASLKLALAHYESFYVVSDDTGAAGKRRPLSELDSVYDSLDVADKPGFVDLLVL